MFLNYGVGEDSWESLGLQGYPTSPSYRKSVLDIHWKDRCWSWSSSSLATWCEESTHWNRPSCWERLKVGGEGDDRWRDGLMASLTQWTWVWANSGSWWWTGKPGMQQSMGLEELDMTEWLSWTKPPDCQEFLGCKFLMCSINCVSKGLIAKSFFPNLKVAF